MKTRVLLSRSTIDESTLRQFLIRFGGRWVEGTEQVVVERGRAVVYVGAESVVDLPPYEVASAESELLGRLGGFVVLDVGHAEGSGALAEEIEQALLLEWGGVSSGDQLFPE